MKILTVENLSKSFGGIHANKDISFDVEEGSILGVIGPNGAGKSTLFDLITGFTKPDAGKVKFFEKNIFGILRMQSHYKDEYLLNEQFQIDVNRNRLSQMHRVKR